LAVTGAEATGVRADLLRRLASQVRFSESPDRELPLAAEAVRSARAAGDRQILAQALIVEHTARADLHYTEERLEIASELVSIAKDIGNPELEFQGQWLRLHDIMELGDPAALNQIDLCLGLAPQLRDAMCIWQAALVRSARASIEGRLSEVERLADEARRVGERTLHGATTAFWVQLLHTEALRRRYAELVQHLAYVADRTPAVPAFRYMLACVYAENGRLPEARVELDRAAAGGFAGLRKDLNWPYTMAFNAATCAALQDAELAAILYQLLLPYGARTLCLPGTPSYLGPVPYYLGLLAAVREDWPTAAEHFETALAAAARLGARGCIGRTQYQYAKMFATRARAGDRQRALRLLDEALAVARDLGLQHLEQDATALRDRLRQTAVGGQSAPEEPPLPGTYPEFTFRHENDFWTLTHAGETLRLKDARGLHYLAHLVRHPDREIFALDLILSSGAKNTESGGRATGSGSSGRGPLLDEKAKTAYKRRLDDLRDELEEAERHNDRGRAEQARGEIDLITQQLAAAFGLSGRHRPVGSDAERARTTATKGIKSAIARIRARNPDMARHLTAAISTGTFCVYRPDRVPPRR
jgi:tetratricopeptide (TPR) repeat protein